ncbi:hypothetical protein [Streptomyces sp. NPDC059957]|uniref:hypothetical protein n=1 Tax=unclassified Streptomyces TaxID=2593676 RepID=UPI0036639827
MGALLAARPGRNVQHVTLRRLPHCVVAMTFVTAPGLRAAEDTARSAWMDWLTCEVLDSWRLVECGGDLMLGVSAAGEESEPPYGW